ncbi:MAG: hypothetical protein AAF959_22025 [Cyanobacteria bacterium P01_D01_bin.56]
MDNEYLYVFLGNMVTVIAVALGISNWLNNKFVSHDELQDKLDLRDYRINDNTNQIKHKADRLYRQISQIAGYLEKQGFINRD